jgi:CubicO group peptidase (beta-lactamase class C family)
MHRVALAIVLAALSGAYAHAQQLDAAVIERTALEQLKATNTPGAALAVVSGDRVIFSHGYGLSSVDTGGPVSPDMLFRLGSTTKMFTASAVVELALEGKIDLDAPVGRYISGLDPAIGRLTGNQLLSHTSGLHDEAPMFGSQDETALGNGIRAWKSDVLFTEPGRIYSYSNPGFWLAGFLAESVSGKPYADVMEDRLFRPLGMKRTTLRPTMAMTWPMAQGHEINNGRPEVIRPAANNAAGWPAGSIFSSVLDLSRFVIAFMNDGAIDGKPVLPPKLIALMSSPHSHPPGSHSSYGYGLDLSENRGVHWVQHGGSRAGYGSLIRMAPERKFAVVIVANRTGSSLPKLADAVVEQMLALKLEPREQPATHALAPDEMRRYAGVFVNGASRYTLAIDNGVLTGGSDRTKTRFSRAGDGFLLGDRGAQEDPPRVALVPDSKGYIEYVFVGGRAFRRSD